MQPCMCDVVTWPIVKVDDPLSAVAWSTAWSELAGPFRRCVELAWESCASGTFACGAVITDPEANVVAEGRNRVFDEPRGECLLEGTALAHTVMNALARVPSGVALNDCTLWSSLEPCLMGLSSALLSSVGEIRFLAPDPLWDGVDGLRALNAFVERRWPLHHEPHDGEWAVFGVAFAQHLGACWQPARSQALAALDFAEPETAVLVRRWVTDRTLVDLAASGAEVEQVLAAVWTDGTDVAEVRATRRM
jgi:tRNA(Arg) A34 adenosine deaminase TadA